MGSVGWLGELVQSNQMVDQTTGPRAFLSSH
jgi:hypothetical protein